MVNPMGGSFGPSFDGYQAHNTTTNPYLNTLFEGVNQTENMINAHAASGGGGGFGGPGGAPLIGPMGGPGGGPPMSAGQQFLNNFIDPLTSRAGNEYQSGLQLAQGAPEGGGEMPEQGGGGPISGLFKGAGAAAGQIPLVGGLVKGVGDVAGELVNTLSLGIL